MPVQNSYFHYLKDCRGMVTSLYSSSDISGQEVIYVSATIPIGVQDLHWGNLIEIHHSIHRYYRLDGSPLARGMSAMHDTFIYEQAVVHVYRQYNGKISAVDPVQVKSREGVPIPLNDSLKQTILSNASLVASFYEELSEEKAAVYLDLHERYTSLEQQICEKVEAKQNIGQDIEDLLRLADQLCRYDDAGNFKSPIFLKRAVIKADSNEEKDAVSPPFLTNIILSPTAPEISKKKKKKLEKRLKKSELNSGVNDLMRQIDDLCSSIKKENKLRIFEQLQPLLQELNDSLLTLDLSFNQNVERFFRQQKTYIHVSNQLLEKFQSEILAGNIDVLEKIYPYIEMNAGAQTFVKKLFEAMGCVQSEETSEKLAGIGKFLYQHSEVYRSLLYSSYNPRKSQSLVPCRVNPTSAFLSASLAVFLLSAAYPLFVMLLEQGLSAEEACNRYGNFAFNAIEVALIFLSDYRDPRFIHKLLEYYPSTQIIRKSSHISLEYVINFTHVQLKELDTQTERYAYMKELSEYSDYFSLACRAAKNTIGYHTEVILTLAARVPLLEVFIEAAHFLTLNFFSSRSNVGARCSRPFIFKAPEECQRYQIALLKPSQKNDRLCLLFVLNQSLSIPDHINSITCALLAKIYADFLILEHSQQQDIVSALKERLDPFWEGDVTHFHRFRAVSVAAHLAFSLLENPCMTDYENMLWIFAYRDMLESKCSSTVPNDILKQQAIAFVDSLAPNVKADLKELQIYKHIFASFYSAPRSEQRITKMNPQPL